MKPMLTDENCPHRDNGWCLDCVQILDTKRDRLYLTYMATAMRLAHIIDVVNAISAEVANEVSNFEESGGDECLN